MAVVRIDTGLFQHPAIIAAGPKAARMWVWGVLWSARERTGGFIPHAAVSALDDEENGPALAHALMQAGLWREVEGGFQIHQDMTDPRAIQWRTHSERLSGKAWRDLREAVFTRDGYTCQYCGASGVPLHCDHIIPLNRGGSNDPTNLTTACESCNMRKHNKRADEWEQM